jgi:hypothetical protein
MEICAEQEKAGLEGVHENRFPIGFRNQEISVLVSVD